MKITRRLYSAPRTVYGDPTYGDAETAIATGYDDFDVCGFCSQPWHEPPICCRAAMNEWQQLEVDLLTTNQPREHHEDR